ncbi:MAG: nucleoside hydrolase [Candidatus Aenigmarchaeota archaeon]|nr:nucleoside hydrolase [Candidatus Aenigmarchaeota archaeon]
MSYKTLIVTDPFNDVDDIVALYTTLKSGKIDVKGVVTTYGDARTRAKGTRKFFGIAGFESVPIHYGVSGNGNFDVPNQMPESGYEFLGEKELASSDDEFGIKPGGEEFISRTIRENPKNISIVSIAPMTSIANAFDIADPSDVKRIYVMAGRVGGYDNRPDAQHHNARVPSYNVACDVEASRKVLNSGAEIYVVGKNLWSDDLFKLEDFEQLKNGTDAQKQLWRMIKLRDEFNVKTLSPFGIKTITYMFDSITMGALLFPELYDFQKIDLRTDDSGIMETKPSRSGKVYGAVDANLPEIKNRLMQIILG